MRKYAIIGFGCAGYHAANAIRAYDCRADIDIYSNHGQAPYNPMLTTYYASDRLSAEGMYPFGTLQDITKRLDVQIYTDTPALHLDGRTVICAAARSTYDGVLVSTGAAAFIPSVAGLDNIPPERIFCMRSFQDAQRLKTAMATGAYRTAVVVGASMVGIKVAELLNGAGIQTLLADMAPYLFPLQLIRNLPS
jgi:assimilatory nitrate reductase electron transfer subunit/3-phenylpropionate/trans-cinnamate dioxygenase ferredoxin reductase subunit